MSLVLPAHCIVGVVMKVTMHYTWRRNPTGDGWGWTWNPVGCLHGITGTHSLLLVALSHIHTHRRPASWRRRSSRSAEVVVLLSGDGWANSGMAWSRGSRRCTPHLSSIYSHRTPTYILILIFFSPYNFSFPHIFLMLTFIITMDKKSDNGDLGFQGTRITGDTQLKSEST
jgi:hypothetical protein